MAILLGGLIASGGLLQRRLHLPDATVLVLQGLLFISILASETLRGRLDWLKPEQPGTGPTPEPKPSQMPHGSKPRATGAITAAMMAAGSSTIPSVAGTTHG